MRVLVATQNPGKMREFRQLLAPLGDRVCFPPDYGLHLEVDEDGQSYADNARIKALAYMEATGLPTLADDSGLEVDALGGAPGIRSARYALGSDADRITGLLARMRDVPWEKRTARFRCVIVIAAPGPEFHTVEGVCEGYIAHQPVGEGGFGYDPIFYLPEYGCTMAQLPPHEKNRISHRARAVQAAMPVLESLLARYG
jgi:XTP/dITP diphosphohydrolase